MNSKKYTLLFALSILFSLNNMVLATNSYGEQPTLGDDSSYIFTHPQEKNMNSIILYALNQETSKLTQYYYDIKLRKITYGQIGETTEFVVENTPFLINLNKEITEGRIDSLELSEVNGLYYNNTSKTGGAGINTSTIQLVNADFINNYAKNFGGAIYKSDIDFIRGDFISNRTDMNGGAINDGSIGSIKGNFIGNNAGGSGGAIRNVDIDSIIGDFIGNSADIDGGAISFNTTDQSISYIKGDFISNTANRFGGVMNDAAIGTIEGNFINNQSARDGGAIFNSKITSITGDFVGNTSGYNGGAIYNSKITNITGNFVGNTSDNNGGSIFGSEITTITGDFIGNKARHGAAIDSGHVETINSNFIGNQVTYYGGAIHSTSIDSLTGNFISNHADIDGGAISMATPDIVIKEIKGNFISNTAQRSGGAINDSTIERIEGNFNNNHAELDGGAINMSSYNPVITYIKGDFISNTAGRYGGAINSANIDTIEGDFIENTSLRFGGAIYKSNINLIKGNFINNSTSEKGGAINDSDINIIEGNFIGNYAAEKGGAIRNSRINTIKGNFIGNYSVFGGGAVSNLAEYKGNYENLFGKFENNKTTSNLINIENGGGAIDNVVLNETDTGVFKNIDAEFISNSTNSYGGAIYNYAKQNTYNATFENVKGKFNNNSAAYGGAIANNNGKFINVDTDFTQNTALYDGGAIYNNNGEFTSISSNFVGNYAANLGGAIYSNTSITLNADGKDTKITENYTSTDNNAIYIANSNATLTLNAVNSGSFFITDSIYGKKGYGLHLTGDNSGSISFQNKDNKYASFNDANVAIDNVNVNLKYDDGKTTDYTLKSLNIEDSANVKVGIDLDITNKANIKADTISAESGNGIILINAINIIGDITPDKIKASVLLGNNNLKLAFDDEFDKGLSLYSKVMLSEDVVTSDVNFDDIFIRKNRIKSYDGYVDIVDNAKAIEIQLNSYSDYVENEVIGDTLSLISNINSPIKSFNFKNPTDKYIVTDTIGEVVGELNVNGKSNKNSKSTIDLANNIGFKLSNEDSKLNLNDVELTGNNTLITASNIDAEVNLDSVILDGDIISNTGYKLNIDGETTINGTVGQAKANLNGGILNLPSNYHFQNADLIVNAGTLNLINNQTQNQVMNSMTINSDFNLFVDADLGNKIMDRLPENTIVNNGAFINVVKINLLSDTEDSSVSIPFAYDSFKDNVMYTGNNILDTNTQVITAYAPVYKYMVNYNNSNGNFEFSKTNEFNPSVLTSPIVSEVGAISTMNHAFNYAFKNADDFMSIPSAERFAMKNQNVYAALPSDAVTDVTSDVVVFSPLFTEAYESSIWIKPYSSFESIPLKNGPKVSNILYGTIVGIDSNMEHIKHGWDRVITGYIGYNGSSQRYEGIDSNENGALVGTTLSLYKDNFFNAITLSAGAGISSSNSVFGHEEYTMIVAGIANKTGYNIELFDDHLIIQPNLLLSYTLVNTFDYTSASGAKIESDPLHAVQVSPGVKFIGHTKNHWQPYLGVSLIWNILDESRVTADGVRLPNMVIKPYVQYGIGIQKKFKDDRIMAFGQTMITNGGRNGVSFTFGLRWLLGNNSNKNKKYEPKKCNSNGEKKYINKK